VTFLSCIVHVVLCCVVLCCVASSKQWTQFILLIVSGLCQTGLMLNMPERPEQYLTLRDVPRNTNLSSRALGTIVSGYD
jgi:hypothetical protein